MRKGIFLLSGELTGVAYIAALRRNHIWSAYYLDNGNMKVT